MELVVCFLLNLNLRIDTFNSFKPTLRPICTIYSLLKQLHSPLCILHHLRKLVVHLVFDVHLSPQYGITQLFYMLPDLQVRHESIYFELTLPR